MNVELMQALADLEKEKGVKKDYMLERIAQALAAAYKAIYKKDAQSAALENVFVQINPETGAIAMHAVKTVTEEVENPAAEISLEEAAQYSPLAQLGDEVRIEIDASKFGRIATQTAKQVIIQGIREAERGMIADEFASKEHEILNGLVTRIDPRYGSVILELGSGRDKTEAVLPVSRSEDVV